MAEQEQMIDSDYTFRLKDGLIGAQMMFVAFGALVLVPILTGLDSNVALFTAGAGTLLFQIITRGKVPVFLASSFAFIAPIIYGVQTWGIPSTMCGLAAAGLFYVVMSFIVRIFGSDMLHRILPPIARTSPKCSMAGARATGTMKSTASQRHSGMTKSGTENQARSTTGCMEIRVGAVQFSRSPGLKEA